MQRDPIKVSWSQATFVCFMPWPRVPGLRTHFFLLGLKRSSRWWFQRFFLNFHPYRSLGMMIQFDGSAYFSDGLVGVEKPPTSHRYSEVTEVTLQLKKSLTWKLGTKSRSQLILPPLYITPSSRHLKKTLWDCHVWYVCWKIWCWLAGWSSSLRRSHTMRCLDDLQWVEGWIQKNMGNMS